MSLSDEERRIIVSREFQKGLQFMKQAEANAEIEIWDVVANRLYYSVFHAVSALLIKDGHKVGTHKGVVMMFGMYYVKTGLVTEDEGSLYSQLQTMREKADYNCAFETKEKDIKYMVPLAKSLLDKVRTLIGDNIE
ncbi:MAG: HEPN domain-containing protein [Prevotellaceae bacterium]|nr:HEPN domain-containing protein [Candidatus Minthosoma equi]